MVGDGCQGALILSLSLSLHDHIHSWHVLVLLRGCQNKGAGVCSLTQIQFKKENKGTEIQTLPVVSLHPLQQQQISRNKTVHCDHCQHCVVKRSGTVSPGSFSLYVSTNKNQQLLTSSSSSLGCCCSSSSSSCCCCCSFSALWQWKTLSRYKQKIKQRSVYGWPTDPSIHSHVWNVPQNIWKQTTDRGADEQ